MSKRTFVTFLGVLLALVSLPSWADSNVRIVRLSLVDGPVQLDRGTGEGFDRAIMNMPITSGMRLWTRDDSRAEVEFEDGSTLRLTPGTKVDFTQLSLRDNGKRSTVITLESGEAYVNYRRKDGEDFRIRTGDREIDLSKSAQLRINVDQQHAAFAVLGGELLADGTKVKKNHTAVLEFTGGAYQVADGIVPDNEDTWNHDRAQYVNTYARNTSYGSGFYGSNVLDYYGSWNDSCWQPNGMSAGWSPYSTGAWVLYPNYGYSWVSPYPWGWQTYRTGVWANSGSGWCWRPNRQYYGLGWAPVYQGNGFVKPQPPAPPVKPGPGTGPVPPTPHYPPGDPRWRGPKSIMLVGDADGQGWWLRHHNPGHGASPTGGAAFTGAAGGTTVGTNPAVTNSGRSTGPRDHRMTSPDVPMNRNAQRDAGRQERQTRREQHSGSNQSAPRMSQPSSRPSSPPRMSSPSPRMSAPPPPRMESPRMESPRMEAPRAEPPRQSAPSSHDGHPK
ncbi:MAG: FecR domain-containing protein [Terriglobales bacterium]